MKVSYTKLKTGEWGMRIEECDEAPKPGASVTVTKRDGSKREEVMGSVVWSGKDKRSDGDVWVATVQRGGDYRAPAQEPQPPPKQPPKDDLSNDPGWDDRVPF
jgi:hypothetical protein